MRHLICIVALLLALPVAAQTKILGVKATPCALAFAEVVSNVADYQAGTSGTTIATGAITLTSGNGAVVLVTVERDSATDCDGVGDITVADSGASNTYDLVSIIHDTGSSNQCSAVFYSGITSTGSVTVTATFVSTDNWRAIAVAEYSGVASGNYATASDATAVSAIVATAAWATPTIDTAASDSLLVGLDVVVSGTGTSNTPTATANERLDVPPFAIEDKLCAGDSTIEGDFSGATRNVSIGMAIKRLP